jgi:hypothetical protein
MEEIPQPVSKGRILILGALLGAVSLFLLWLGGGRIVSPLSLGLALLAFLIAAVIEVRAHSKATTAFERGRIEAGMEPPSVLPPQDGPDGSRFRM